MEKAEEGSQTAAVRAPLTISRLSMPTLRRLAATQLMSFSLIHDLNSLTAKAADTPGGETRTHSQAKIKRSRNKKLHFLGQVSGTPPYLP